MVLKHFILISPPDKAVNSAATCDGVLQKTSLREIDCSNAEACMSRHFHGVLQDFYHIVLFAIVLGSTDLFISRGFKFSYT